MVNIHQDDWDDLLDNILCAYRTSHQASTKCTPFLLMFGQEAQLSIMQFDMSEASCKRAAQRALISFSEKVEKMLDMQKSSHDQARHAEHPESTGETKTSV